MIFIILSCSLLTIILIYLTTLRIDLLEFVLIVICFIGIIWILYTENTREGFSGEDEDGWENIDMDKFQKMSSLPNQIKDMIVKPIKQMTEQISGEGPDVNELEPISEIGYIREKDEYVGSEKEVKGGKKFVIDDVQFKKMKFEYQKIDFMLGLLKKGNKQLYKQIVPDAKTENDEKDAQELEDQIEKDGGK